MSILSAKPLFNPQGDTDKNSRRMIGGNTTNLNDFNNMKYTWASSWYRQAMNNFWIPEEINLSADLKDYKNLTAAERTAYDKILSFLVFLDSIQTANLPCIAQYITANEVNLCLTIQGFQEAVHSQSYSYMLDSICSPVERDRILYQWKEDEHLLRRNTFIGNLYNEFQEKKDDVTLLRVIMANYILEGTNLFHGLLSLCVKLGGVGPKNFAVSLKETSLHDHICYIRRIGLIHQFLNGKNIGMETRMAYVDQNQICFASRLQTAKVFTDSSSSADGCSIECILRTHLITLCTSQLSSQSYHPHLSHHIYAAASSTNDGVDIIDQKINKWNQFSIQHGLIQTSNSLSMEMADRLSIFWGGVLESPQQSFFMQSMVATENFYRRGSILMIGLFAFVLCFINTDHENSAGIHCMLGCTTYEQLAGCIY